MAKLIDLDAESYFQRQLLEGVARTFALTIPQLKPQLARVVSNAYLLCRIADTIEDEINLSPSQKHTLSKLFIDVVAGDEAAEAFRDAFVPLLSDRRLPAERELIEQTPRVIKITHRFTPEQRIALEKCVRVMGEGMAFYQAHSSSTGLESREQFDNYCYHVAGVVGELLTELVCEQNDELNANRLQLRTLALSFGQGLQMVNILKDIWKDRQRGVCWLPKDVFEAAGYDLSQLSPETITPDYVAGIRTLVSIAFTHLQNALRYVQLIPKQEKGLRKFCLWALAMAILTLRNINKHADFKSESEVKITRKDVASVVAAVKVLERSNHLLRATFTIMSLGLSGVADVTTSKSHEHIRTWFNLQLSELNG